jgi:hypothetical protein
MAPVVPLPCSTIVRCVGADLVVVLELGVHALDALLHVQDLRLTRLHLMGKHNTQKQAFRGSALGYLADSHVPSYTMALRRIWCIHNGCTCFLSSLIL